MNTTPKKVYLVWKGEDDNDDNDFFTQYDSIEDAVVAERDEFENGEVPIYEASPEFIGTFVSKAVVRKKSK